MLSYTENVFTAIIVFNERKNSQQISRLILENLTKYSKTEKHNKQSSCDISQLLKSNSRPEGTEDSYLTLTVQW